MSEEKSNYRLKSKFVEMPKQVKVPITSSELIVITKTKNLVKYIFDITKNSPKKFRLTFVTKMQNLSLEIIELLYKANDVMICKQNLSQRLAYQSNALTNLKILEYIALLSLENQCILKKQYEQIAKQGSECMILLGNWIKSDRRRVSNSNIT